MEEGGNEAGKANGELEPNHNRRRRWHLPQSHRRDTRSGSRGRRSRRRAACSCRRPGQRPHVGVPLFQREVGPMGPGPRSSARREGAAAGGPLDQTASARRVASARNSKPRPAHSATAPRVPTALVRVPNVPHAAKGSRRTSALVQLVMKAAVHAIARGKYRRRHVVDRLADTAAHHHEESEDHHKADAPPPLVEVKNAALAAACLAASSRVSGTFPRGGGRPRIAVTGPRSPWPIVPTQTRATGRPLGQGAGRCCERVLPTPERGGVAVVPPPSRPVGQVGSA